jgi:regulator of sirC expression with transglutaminase-like and TPR domain
MVEFITAVEAEYYLSSIGEKPDSEIDLFACAMAFGLSDRFDADIQKYRTQFDEMSDALRVCFDQTAAANNGDDVNVMAKSLAKIMSETYAYLGDDVSYDDLKNINITHVMDRRLGIPITLCVLAIALCRAQGWSASGVNFPGHFLMRLDKGGERVMIDPFQQCKILEAKDMRLILKRVMGDSAELSSDYYEACSNRDILLRLQNNIKYRLIDSGDYNTALKTVMQMALIAPDDYRLNLDKAVLFSRLDQTKAAIENIEIYLNHVTDPQDKADAQDFLSQLKRQLN